MLKVPDAKPTIRTLAKMAGVSNATVSLALRNHPRIRPEVRKRIQRIAEQVGYKSNPVVANLLAQLRASKAVTFQSTLGLLYLGNDQKLLEGVPTFRAWVKGCRERATSLGYGLDWLSLAQDGVSPERLIRILHARNIKGLIVIGPFENNIISPELNSVWERTAAIVIGVRAIRPPLTFVSNDQFSTTMRAVKEVTRLGYKRPGLCINPAVDGSVENRFSGGFTAAQGKLPIENRLPVFDYERVEADSNSIDRFNSWCQEYRPDVILSVHDEIDAWLDPLNLKVPEDIGLVHLDKTSNVRWAGIEQNSELIGCAAVDMVIGQLHRNEIGVPPFQKCMFISGTWVSGPTVRKQVRSDPGKASKRNGRRRLQ